MVLLLVTLFSKRAVKPVAESYERQKQFVTDANHELKTPLTLIQANLDILEAESGPSEWLTDIREETELMSQLVGKTGHSGPDGRGNHSSGDPSV